jgi:hypothetical protein
LAIGHPNLNSFPSPWRRQIKDVESNMRTKCVEPKIPEARRWPVRILSDQGTIEGETRDISFDGIYICMDEPLRLNEKFRMAISPPNRQAIGVTGKVVWSDMYALDEEETPFAMGMSLVKISRKDLKAIEYAL